MHLARLAFVGNSVPRRCGIATFTSDLQQAIAKSRRSLTASIVAMTDNAHCYEYPPDVQHQVHDSELSEYGKAADFLNEARYQVVCLQHEFGIFGGVAGSHIMAMLSRLTMPVVTTLHTVLAEPDIAQCRVLTQITEASSTVVVMAEKARDLLRTVYRVPAKKIAVIAHGIPDSAFAEPGPAKIRLGFGGRPVILTFGLLSPNKGIEVMIDAMPRILKERPDAVYVVLGATHPNLIRHEGEGYRNSLVERARGLGVGQNVVFMNRFVDQAILLDFISMCDVYVTPYLNETQMTSGTLAYSFGLGKAVVSTPYWHAQELLAQGRGVLVPFGDADAIGTEIANLLCDDTRRNAMRERAYLSSRSMTWERTAERYLDVFESARRAAPLKPAPGQPSRLSAGDELNLPPVRLAHFLAMCDDTGLFQHAVCSVPDRVHGYCVDDNARALLVACALNSPGELPLADTHVSRLAAFVQHAWNPDTKRFRNFMSFERRWLEDIGSEDSHGRTLWALGECARSDACKSRRRWAVALFKEALPSVAAFTSPRAWAFTLLGLEAFGENAAEDPSYRDMRYLLADRLMNLLVSVATDDWVWFEEGLSYDNARLAQALIATGASMKHAAYLAAGLRSLRWLTKQQTSDEGIFRPVGSDTFGEKRTRPRAFDQQPLEATATVSACIAAWHSDGDIYWKRSAGQALAWFLGENDLSLPLVDVETGSCRDGLHPDRANENRGGESVVSYLLSLVEMRQFELMVKALALDAGSVTLRPSTKIEMTLPTKGSPLEYNIPAVR